MRRHPHAIIAGDFNVEDIAWDTDEVSATCGSANARKLVAIKEQFSLTQHQREITRPSSNAVLDLVFSTHPNLVSRIEVVPGMSDHLAVLTTLDVRPKQHSNKLSHTVYKYKSANFEGLRAHMAAYASMFLMENPTSRTTEENWKSFKSALHQAIIKHVPTTKSKTKRHLPIAGVLSVIFQQSYEEGTVPSDWLTARISAIYKKGDKANPSNYRPVSLTCITCKIMEHIVCSQIGRHLDHNNILHPNQHGFRKGLSCETQLVDTIHELAYSINQKTQTDVIFLDFSKAFDKVSHDTLLHKIRYYGIGGKTNTWISAFLCSRSQQVVVNGQTSQSAGVLSGVPQGSVLGPLLFLMYINDIAEGVTSQMRMFADDSIVYRQIHTPADMADGF